MDSDSLKGLLTKCYQGEAEAETHKIRHTPLFGLIGKITELFCFNDSVNAKTLAVQATQCILGDSCKGLVVFRAIAR